jgi:methionyl-tRNA formyltransferase
MANSKMSNSVLLLGSTDITLAVAEAVIATGLTLSAIVNVSDQFSISYSDTPVQNVRACDLDRWASARGVGIIPFTHYDDVLGRLDQEMPQVCLVAGWYHMVPKHFRSAFTRGCYGFHASLLPQLRGGAPLNWAILINCTVTGVSLFELTDGIDDGPIFAQERFPIESRSTIGELVLASREACRQLTIQCLPRLLAGTLPGYQQSGKPSYGLQRGPGDGSIDWTLPAEQIDRLVRAVGRPYSGAFTRLGEHLIRIWVSDLPTSPPLVFGAPGQIARVPGCDHPLVVTGEGVLAIVEATDVDGADCLDKLLKSGHKRLARS